MTVVCGWAYSPLNLNSAKWVNSTVDVVGEGKVHCKKWISAPLPSLGIGSMNCGCWRAVVSMCW